MIRLQKDENETNIDNILNDIPNVTDDVEDNLNLDESDTNLEQGDNLDSFSKEVISALKSKNMPLLPLNYQAYFEQMLDNKNIEFQKKIYSLMETDTRNDERNINFEKTIHIAFANTRDILKCTSSIYKNLMLVNDIEKKCLNELNNNVISTKFIQETNSLQMQIDSQINQLKILYQKCNKILENINTNTMYDSKFDTYNKRYFINLVQDEKKMVEKFNHTSTIIMMTIPLIVTRYIKNDQTTALIIMKTIAKLLLKTSRRSDIIGYIGNGIFAMLLKHSDVFAAKKASERLIELLRNTNVILGNKEINLDLNIGISKLKSDRSAEESLNFAINALRNAQRSNTNYIIYKDDIDENQT
ncbi:diguanylate cyclase domain-containing protein [Helicobacter sp. MIT 14-3879]|uniref:GGDEF domain-containing protein n=1 Tax=Helicobacter sp. MIT 14-3879 TaxID=2040649 RepID=UPI000E1F26C6|nr:diguanylate cyclase [Helicobacter sp. MIT 14-3879]RDU65035.1 hypothetical protein CQA44_01620 [Helicobacter sp. MIT 14-3879]